MKIDIHLISYLAQFFLEWEMFHKKVSEKIKIHISSSIIFFSQNSTAYEIMWLNIVEPKSP